MLKKRLRQVSEIHLEFRMTKEVKKSLTISECILTKYERTLQHCEQ